MEGTQEAGGVNGSQVSGLSPWVGEEGGRREGDLGESVGLCLQLAEFEMLVSSTWRHLNPGVWSSNRMSALETQTWGPQHTGAFMAMGKGGLGWGEKRAQGEPGKSPLPDQKEEAESEVT